MLNSIYSTSIHLQSTRVLDAYRESCCGSLGYGVHIFLFITIAYHNFNNNFFRWKYSITCERKFHIKTEWKNACIQPHFIIPQQITVMLLLFSTPKYRSKDCIILLLFLLWATDAMQKNWIKRITTKRHQINHAMFGAWYVCNDRMNGGKKTIKIIKMIQI